MAGVLFSYAHANTVQEGTGGGGGDTNSADYQAKAAAADPGVGTSQSANFMYDHGTLWFDDGLVDIALLPPPTTGGGSGSGGGSSGNGSSGGGSPTASSESVSGGSGGGSSGSGWIASFFGENQNPQVGGIAPEADVPFTDTPAVTEAVRDIPQATEAAVRVEDAPARIARVIKYPQKTPHIIRLVDESGVTRDLDIVLFKRIVPWPLWIALLLVILGIVTLCVYAAGRGKDGWLLWVGGALIVLGIIIGLVVRYAYRAVPIDTNVISSVAVIPVNEANAAVKKLMNDLPLGVHVIEATDAIGKKVLTIKVFITPALPL